MALPEYEADGKAEAGWAGIVGPTVGLVAVALALHEGTPPVLDAAVVAFVAATIRPVLGHLLPSPPLPAP